MINITQGAGFESSILAYIVSKKDISTVIVILDQSLRRNTSQINGEDQWLQCFGDLVQKTMNHDLSISVVFAQNFHRSLNND